jgi:hypothetical protein
MHNHKRKKTLGKSRLRWEDNIKMYIEEQDMRVWTGYIWLRTETSGGLL